MALEAGNKLRGLRASLSPCLQVLKHTRFASTAYARLPLLASPTKSLPLPPGAPRTAAGRGPRSLGALASLLEASRCFQDPLRRRVPRRQGHGWQRRRPPAGATFSCLGGSRAFFSCMRKRSEYGADFLGSGRPHEFKATQGHQVRNRIAMSKNQYNIQHNQPIEGAPTKLVADTRISLGLRPN